MRTATTRRMLTRKALKMRTGRRVMRCDEGKGKRGDYKKYVVGDTLDTFRTLLFRKKKSIF